MSSLHSIDDCPEIVDDGSIAYDLFEEIEKNRKKEEHTPHKQTKSVAVLPSTVMKRKEALDRGMKVAYKNFTAINPVSGPVMKQQYHSINVWDYLPDGYDPRKDKPVPPKSRARRSGTRPGHKTSNKIAMPQRPAAAKHTELQTFQRAMFRPEVAKIEDIETSRFGISPNPGKVEDSHRAENVLEKQVEHCIEDEEETQRARLELEKDQQLLRDTNEQKAREQAAMHTRVMRALVALPSVCCYFTRLRASFRRLRLQRESCALRMQYFYRHHVKRYLTAKYWGSVQWPLRFIIKSRILRKRTAARRLAVFLADYDKVPIYVHVHHFFKRVRSSMRHVRNFLATNRARKELIERMWARQEMQVRKHLAVKEAKLVEKLKREQKERILAQVSRNKNGKGVGNTHAKWLAKQEEVNLMLSRADVVQGQYRSSVRTTDHFLHADQDYDAEASECTPEKNSSVPKALVEENFACMDPKERYEIITQLIARKRRRHIVNVMEDSDERSRTRGIVTCHDVRSFLKEQVAPQRSKRRSSLVHMTGCMTEGLHRINDMARDQDLPRVKRGFLMLTDQNLGPSWNRLIYDNIVKYLKDA